MCRRIRKYLYITSLLLGLWLGVKFFLPLAFPFLLGGLLALAAEPAVALLCRAGLRRGGAAGLGVTGALCLILILLLFLGALVLRELAALAALLPDLEGAADQGIAALSSWALQVAARFPTGIRELLNQTVTDFFSGSSQLLDQGFRYAISLTGGLLTRVPDSALILGTAMISSYMISVRLPKIKTWLREKLSQERIAKILAGFRRFRAAMGGWLKAQCKLMGLTWLILTMGFIVLRIPYAPLWATLVALVDALPILGTGTVLLPWALVSFLQADTARAVGLLGVYAAVALTRSVMEPKLLGSQLGLDPLATLAVLYGGYKIWGLGGMIFAPVLAVAVVQMAREAN